MSDRDTENRMEELVFEVELEAPPEKVWRAMHLAEFRRKWLPDNVLADPEPVESVPGREVRYRMQDDVPPFFRSLVTFEIWPGANDGTLLRIVHRLTDARLQSGLGPPANNNGRPLMRAA
ncbi:MAG: SRPBCC family protein [Geminicoccaceae bacterium]